MAKAKRGKKQRGQFPTIPLNTCMEVAGIALIGVAVVSILSLLSFSHGALTSTWLHLLRLISGWGAYLLPFGLGAVGLWLFLYGYGRPVRVPLEIVAGALLLYLGSLGLLHYFSMEPQTLALTGGGGGYLGWWISGALIGALGDVGALLVLLTILAIGCIALFGISVTDIVRHGVELWRRVVDWYRFRSVGMRGAAAPPRDDSLAARLMARVEEKPALSTPPVRPAPAPNDALFPRVVGGLPPTAEWRLPSFEELLDKGADQELDRPRYGREHALLRRRWPISACQPRSWRSIKALL